MPQALCLLRLAARFRHTSSFACRVWRRERLAPAWMTALDGLLGTNDHGLGRQDAHPSPPAYPRCRWPPAGVANTFSNPLVPNVPNVLAPWTYFEMLITVPAAAHSGCAIEVTAHPAGRVGGQLGVRRREAVEHHPARPVAHEVPAWDDRPGRAIGPGGRDGCGARAPATPGRPASAGEDKEVS
jgi:hypothetical protein